jgi:hypothetical protein
MTDQDRFRDWQRLAKATTFLFNSPESPERMGRILEDFVDTVLPDESSGEHFGRRLLALGERVTRDKPERPADEDPYEDWCQEFGSALADILQDDRTPLAVWRAAEEMQTKLDDWIKKAKPEGHTIRSVRTILPELLITVWCEGDEGDETPAPVEPERIPTTEAEMLIEIGRLREQLKEAREAEAVAVGCYRQLEEWHGPGPVQVALKGEEDETDAFAAGAAG